MDNLVFRDIRTKDADGPPQLRLVGDFDTLYKKNIDPWGQSGVDDSPMSRYYDHSRARLITALRRTGFTHTSCGLEVGCGHGHVTSLLSTALGLGGSCWFGLDISPTAVKHAASLYNELLFFAGDILEAKTLPYRLFDAVVLNQMWWYVMHQHEQLLHNAHSLLERNGLLVISQAFLEEQNYGREIADGFSGMLKCLMAPGFDLIYVQYDDTGRFIHHDGVAVFRKKS